ncbi:MAG: YbbR-like domain-containing protein [Pyrinomonadaceae bacterium]
MASKGEKLTDGAQLSLHFKNILRKIFLEDWAMKLAALVITFALWMGVTGLSQPTTQRMSGIPLNIRLSNDIGVTNSPAQEVDIIISGDKRKIDQINKYELTMSLDLTGVEPGDRLVRLTPDIVSLALPNGIRLDEIQPPSILVKLEAIEQREVPVNVLTEGSVGEEMEIYGTPTVTPDKVLVRGPANLVRSLTSVSTEKIDLSNRNADFTVRQVPVNVSNPKITPLGALVDVSFRIGEKRIEKSFSVPVKDDPKRKVNVVLYGGKSLFEGIKADDITVEIVQDSAGKGTPTVTLPSSIAGRVEIRRPKAGG